MMILMASSEIKMTIHVCDEGCVELGPIKKMVAVVCDVR